MKKSTRSKSRGSTIVEMALVITPFLILLFGVFSYGYMAFERSSVDYQIDHIADNLPDNYASMSAANAIKTAMTQNHLIDGSKLVVSNATITQRHQANVTDRDGVAIQLGGESSRKASTDLVVKAKITYKLKPFIDFGGALPATDYVRTFNQALVLEREYEIS